MIKKTKNKKKTPSKQIQWKQYNTPDCDACILIRFKVDLAKEGKNKTKTKTGLNLAFKSIHTNLLITDDAHLKLAVK